jgi:hypothetical protein
MKRKLVSKSAFLTPRFLIFLFLCTAAAGSMLSAARLAFFHPEGLTNVTVSGSTGADGGYATLADAFAALNANPNQTGNVISVSIVGDTIEIGTGASLNAPPGLRKKMGHAAIKLAKSVDRRQLDLVDH